MAIYEETDTLKNKKRFKYMPDTVKKKQDILTGAKPKEGTPLYSFLKKARKISAFNAKELSACNIDPYKGDMSYEEFVDAYLQALHRRADLIPNIYCSRAWLLAHKAVLTPSVNSLGYMSFTKNDNPNIFFIPAYKYMDNDILFKTDSCLVTFPLALSGSDGLRYDVQYMYTRDVSVYMIPKALKVRNTMRNIPYITYPVLYSDHSKDDKIKLFFESYKHRAKYKHRIMTDDFSGFENMLFNYYGQHRYFIERTDMHKILGVIIWEDIGDVIHMLYSVGCMESAKEYGEFSSNKEFYATKALRYPETILRYEFMKRFPIGTIFNGGGCSCYDSIRWMQEISQPSHIYELRTYADVRCTVRKGMKQIPVGLLPWEYIMAGRHNKRFRVDEMNRVLFQKGLKKRVKFKNTPSRHRKRQIAKILKLKEYGKLLGKY